MKTCTAVLKNLYSIVVILLFGALVSACCVSGKKVEITDAMIAPEYKDFNGTMLVLESYRGIDIGFKNRFEDHYKGEWVFAKKSELNDTYADIENYRYAVGGELSPGAGDAHKVRHWMLDRKTKKKYYTPYTNGAGKQQTNFVKYIEERRKKG